MDSYIVIFESKYDTSEMVNYIKTLDKWGRLTINAYVVRSFKSASQIRDELVAIKSPGDRIIVIKSGYVAAWSNARASNDWLKKNI